MDCNNRVLRKFQSLYFEGKMFANSILGLPAQTSKEIQIFKIILDHFKNDHKIKIFEWGSGFSTTYYADYLHKKKVDFEWHTIDNSKTWHEKIKALVKKKNLESYIGLYLREFKPFWEKPHWGPIPPACGVFGPKSENEKSYIRFPSILKDRFDLVIIDARFRRHCIQTTKEILLPEGIAILHDAQKTHYHVGLDDFRYRTFLNTGSWYPFQKMLNKVWIGSMGNSKIFETLKRFR
jgi:hypothetical protein